MVIFFCWGPLCGYYIGEFFIIELFLLANFLMTNESFRYRSCRLILTPKLSFHLDQTRRVSGLWTISRMASFATRTDQ